MTNWYYHAPGQGRVGPLTAEEMRKRYRERQIVRDTLAWHEGLREWQPLDRLIEELGLTGVEPDMSLPPPPPPVRRPAAATASHAARPTLPVEPPPSNRSGCIIAAIVIGVGGLFLVGILAAIALPAYQDYVKRAKAAQTGQAAPAGAASAPTATYDAGRMEAVDGLARELITVSMREFYAANGNVCPDTFEFERMMVRYPRYQGSESGGWFSIDPARPASGVCAYAVRFHGLGTEVADKTVQYEASLAGENITIYCRNIDLPAGFAPPRCGA